MATGCDWLPTIAEICGVALPEGQLDGKSLLPVITSPDAPSPHETFYWQLGRGRNPQWVVRQGDWKLLGNPRDTSGKAPLTKEDKRFLANLAEDVTEMENLAGEHPDVVERLQGLRDQFVEDIGAGK
jgi:arylsulfatase A-like enzyme